MRFAQQQTQTQREGESLRICKYLATAMSSQTIGMRCSLTGSLGACSRKLSAARGSVACFSGRSMPPIHPKRRILLSIGIGTLIGPAIAEEEALRFSSKSGLFSFDYPSSWLLAYDRSKGNPAGPQVLLGDFKNVDTVSVRRLQDAAQRFSGDSVDPLQVAQFVTEDMRLSAQTLKYNMMKADRISPGRFAFELYVESCRGEVQEGAGGVMQCLGPKLQDLQPVRRHFVGAVVFDGPDILFLSGGTPEERWASVAPTLARVTESFFVTAR